MSNYILVEDGEVKLDLGPGDEPLEIDLTDTTDRVDIGT